MCNYSDGGGGFHAAEARAAAEAAAKALAAGRVVAEQEAAGRAVTVRAAAEDRETTLFYRVGGWTSDRVCACTCEPYSVAATLLLYILSGYRVQLSLIIDSVWAVAACGSR